MRQAHSEDTSDSLRGMETTAEGAPAAEAADSTGNLADQLLRLTRRLHRAQHRHLQPLGITPAAARLLRAVAHCTEPPRMVDLAQRLDIVPRSVTTLVDALEAGGLVLRLPDPANRRVIRVRLTDRGDGVLHRLRAARRAAAEELLAPLDTAQRAQLGMLLAALAEEPGAAAPATREG